jgi:hypothetical protein
VIGSHPGARRCDVLPEAGDAVGVSSAVRPVATVWAILGASVYLQETGDRVESVYSSVVLISGYMSSHDSSALR